MDLFTLAGKVIEALETEGGRLRAVIESIQPDLRLGWQLPHTMRLLPS